MVTKHTHKVLIVDDDTQVLNELKDLLQEYFEVITAANGKLGVEMARKFSPDIVIMDIVMPVMDGIEACMEMRSIEILKKSIVIFYTARNEDYSQVAGFNAGADDYIVKPVRPK